MEKDFKRTEPIKPKNTIGYASGSNVTHELAKTDNVDNSTKQVVPQNSIVRCCVGDSANAVVPEKTIRTEYVCCSALKDDTKQESE